MKNSKMSKFWRGYIMDVILKKVRLYCDKKARIHTDKKTGNMEIRYTIWDKVKRTKRSSTMDEAGAHHLFHELYPE